MVNVVNRNGISSSAVTTRAAEPADAALILTFIVELAEYERLRHECVATEKQIAAALFGDAPRVFCDIADVGGEPAGFALWFYTYSTFRARHGIYLEDLYVRPAFRGRGAGKALLAHLAQRATREDCGRFEWSVLDWNAPSIAFYDSVGARAVSGWTRYRIDGDALMRLGAA